MRPALRNPHPFNPAWNWRNSRCRTCGTLHAQSYAKLASLELCRMCARQAELEARAFARSTGRFLSAYPEG